MDGLHQSTTDTRIFSPLLAHGEWLEDRPLVPVPHRKYLFAPSKWRGWHGPGFLRKKQNVPIKPRFKTGK
jgi:hypothetical protein